MCFAIFTDYGVQILMRCSSTPQERCITIDFAAQFEVSQYHLTKVVQDLVRRSFITTRRGIGGGTSLARNANEIRLCNVVRYLEHRFALVECFQGDGDRKGPDGVVDHYQRKMGDPDRREQPR